MSSGVDDADGHKDRKDTYVHSELKNMCDKLRAENERWMRLQVLCGVSLRSLVVKFYRNNYTLTHTT